MVAESLPNILILSLYLVIGCIGNGIVIIIYRFKMRNTLDNRIYIPCLAVADLISAVLCSVFAIYALVFPISYTNIVVCKISWYTMTWSTFVAASILMMIATQRYIKICRPLTKSFFTGKEIITVGLFYVCAFIIDSPILFMAGITTTRFENTTEEFCDRVGEHYRTGSKHTFAIAYTVFEASSFPIIAFGIIFFYYKVSSTLSDRMNGKAKKINTLPNDAEETSAVETDVNITEAEVVDKKIKNKNKKLITYKSKAQSSNRHNDSGVGISDDFEGKPTCSHVQLFEPDHAHSDNTHRMYSDKVVKPDIPLTSTQKTDLPLTSTQKNIKANDKSNVDLSLTAENTIQQTRVTCGKTTKIVRTNQKAAPIRLFFKQHRYTVIFITITITFFITYLPRVVLMLLEKIQTDFWKKFQGKPSLQVMIFLNRLHIINCIINPLLYGIFDEKFKYHFIKLFKLRCMNNKVSAS
ncbi:Hypothetical predicted protein [Mytilus galloprovincialis]|uniref:G-protein coupled receptors family 1 profile domain-containing protein n=1 Tax=Mytilus galloprovincialis TaxID=29158 RepID=A0A8B6G3N5_MYTGA|nr:Hypothetical predicted protein [Mytilus galloprovincialis]